METKEEALSELNISQTQILLLVETNQEISLKNAHDFLKNRQNPTSLVPIKPQGRIAFLYYSPGKEADWKADGYRWAEYGRKLLPRSTPLVEKRYYHILVKQDNVIVRTKEFRKLIFHLAGDSEGHQGTLIQYLGAAPKDGVLYPHGNTKKEFKPYMKTAPSVLKEARESHVSPAIHYKQKVACPNTPLSHDAILKPRNAKQIKNAKAFVRKKMYTQDELYNLAELTHDLQEYVHRFFLVPEVGVVLAHRAMLQEFRAVLSTTTHQAQLLSYQTTDKVGDFYVSSLLFRHTLFNEAPVMPVAFLIHENKTQFSQELFMNIIAMEVPEVTGALLIAEEEENISKALSNQLPQVRQLHNWNHIQSKVKNWLKEHNDCQSKCRSHVQDLKQLLMSSSEEEYRKMYNGYCQKWSESFVEYYNQKVHPEVISCAGRWILEPLGVYNGYNGVCADQCEGFNDLLRILTQRNESTIDSLVLGLYFLQNYFSNEIQRGLAGLGDYHLLDIFKAMRIPVDEMNLQNCFSPDEIVEKMIAWRNNKDILSFGENEQQLMEERETESEVNLNRENQYKNIKPILNKVEVIIPACKMVRAQLIIENKNCIYHSDLKKFTVQGTSGTHEVRLFPKEACTCPEKKDCYHIIAAKLYLGMNVSQNTTRRLTINQFRKNCRDKCRKEKCRKQPLKIAKEEVPSLVNCSNNQAPYNSLLVFDNQPILFENQSVVYINHSSQRTSVQEDQQGNIFAQEASQECINELQKEL